MFRLNWWCKKHKKLRNTMSKANSPNARLCFGKKQLTATTNQRLRHVPGETLIHGLEWDVHVNIGDISLQN